MDERITGRRDMFAFVVAVPVAVLGWAISYLALAVLLDGLPAARQDLLTIALGGLLVGLPFAIAAVVLAGAFYAVLESTIGVERRTALAGAAIIGFAIALMVMRLMGSWSFLDPMRGALIGVFTAEVWWRLRTRAETGSGPE